MAQMYFHCVSSEGVLLDRRGSEIYDLAEACEHAAQVVLKMHRHAWSAGLARLDSEGQRWGGRGTVRPSVLNDAW